MRSSARKAHDRCRFYCGTRRQLRASPEKACFGLEDLMFRTHATLKAGLAALMLGGAILASATSAEAGAGTGTWRNGMVAGPYGAGYYGHGYGPARYGYRRSHGNGGAVAAGLIGGLALGALATAPAYSYPAYPAYPA